MNTECNEMFAKTINVDDNNIVYTSLNQDIERNDVLPESIEAIFTNGDNNYSDTSNKSLSKNVDDNFINTVATWAIKYGITHCALIGLLNILNIFTNTTFSKDPRTLLQTPRNTDVVTMSNGQYCHFNINSIVQNIIYDIRESGINVAILDLLINIDEMSISRSSNACFWPILLSENVCGKVYVAGLYYGYTKPKDCNEFLSKFVSDIKPLITRGYIDNDVTVK
ncbi:uncharacterized protein LOC116852678 isoform X4 [Odontomachus brunneus]|uniref:uncharacterized protein LOC116852678 isoform X4 n=1 Tax=Odontomachus brunneus TaxID=486640 RepID=UPI0013F2932D|nr:uncharacterized protein LOC116852678 isoform X4 [Odontomachus brunneus]